MIHDHCVIGGGIVGLAVALALSRKTPEASILLIEKEASFATHQTGHNSGVIHSGIYYSPGSLKATLCKAGAAATVRFCTDHGVPFETRGKLIVATDRQELVRMEALARTAGHNGIAVEILDVRGIAEREPNVTGLGAILVPGTGIVDYRRICEVMAGQLRDAGCGFALAHAVDEIREEPDVVKIGAGGTIHTARSVVVCGGLQADRLARMAGIGIDHRIVPFRGEYYDIVPEKRGLVRHLIYPVPDPALPFLGIHLTPHIDGGLSVGPNAVLGFAREGYGRFSFSPRDVADFATFPGFWRVMARNWPSGLSEARNSLLKSMYLRECRKYCPSLDLEDLVPRAAGIRAQAVMRDGTLVQDFLFVQTKRMLHVCNAPSPAATSAIPIADMVVAKMRSP